MAGREVLKLLSALLFVLGGGILILTGSGLYLGPLLFGPADQPLNGVSPVVVLLFLLLTICVGMMLGVVLWISVWRAFLGRDEIERYLAEPDVPLVSDILRKILDVVYRE